jgi:prefoldin subunit 5
METSTSCHVLDGANFTILLNLPIEGENLENKKLGIVLLLILALTPYIHGVAAQNDMQTFFELSLPGVEIRVDSVKEVRPGENITVSLYVKGAAKRVYVVYLNLTVFGFIEGQNKTILMSLSKGDFSLNYNQTWEYSDSFTVPVNVWDATYGELSFKYSIEGFSYEFPRIGFTMTHVENVLLKSLQEQLENLTEAYKELSKAYNVLNESYTSVSEHLQTLQQKYSQLNESYAALNQTYWKLKESVGGLETARSTMFIFLATTIIFAATTAYMILRKPKTY